MLLRSKSINALSTTGLYLTDKLLPNLGIAGEVTSKIRGGTLATVATGEVEIAIRPVSELVNVPGIDLSDQSLRRFNRAIVGLDHLGGEDDGEAEPQGPSFDQSNQ